MRTLYVCVRNAWRMGALLALLIALVACSSAAADTGKEIAVKGDDNGGQIELNKGDVLIISLDANPSTGYAWEKAGGDEAVLAQKGDPEYKAGSPALGASGTQTLRFDAARAGETTLKLVYHRAWEKGVEPIETFTLHVVVK